MIKLAGKKVRLGQGLKESLQLETNFSWHLQVVNLSSLTCKMALESKYLASFKAGQ